MCGDEDPGLLLSAQILPLMDLFFQCFGKLERAFRRWQCLSDERNDGGRVAHVRAIISVVCAQWPTLLDRFDEEVFGVFALP